MPLSPTFLTPMLLLCGVEEEALVICTGTLVAVWVVRDNDDDGKKEEEAGVTLL